jgi:hypothetical protein
MSEIHRVFSLSHKRQLFCIQNLAYYAGVEIPLFITWFHSRWLSLSFSDHSGTATVTDPVADGVIHG